MKVSKRAQKYQVVLVPLVLIQMTDSPLMLGLAGVLILVGMYITEKIWVEAPQRIPLA